MKKTIILHMFQWKLKDIAKSLQLVKDQGFTHIQISPLQPCKEANAWWDCYQIFDFSIGNKYGSKEDLIELCNEAKKYGITIIVDIICNHVASSNDEALDIHDKVNKKLVNNVFFWKERKQINDWNNRYEVTHYCSGLPTLNLKNYDLQDIIIEFLNSLIDCGVGGFRFDSAKNIELPEEGSDFWPRVIENIKNKDNMLLYAEIIFCNKELINKYCNYINVITSSSGDNKDKLITYVENHDTYLEFGYTKNIDDNTMIKEFDILLQNFNNILFYVRPYQDKYKDLWKSDKLKNVMLSYNNSRQ